MKHSLLFLIGILTGTIFIISGRYSERLDKLKVKIESLEKRQIEILRACEEGLTNE